MTRPSTPPSLQPRTNRWQRLAILFLVALLVLGLVERNRILSLLRGPAMVLSNPTLTLAAGDSTVVQVEHSALQVSSSPQVRYMWVIRGPSESGSGPKNILVERPLSPEQMRQSGILRFSLPRRLAMDTPGIMECYIERQTLAKDGRSIAESERLSNVLSIP